MLGAGDTEGMDTTPALEKGLVYWRGQARKKAVAIRVMGCKSSEKHQTNLRSEKPSWRRRHLSWDELAAEDSQHNEILCGTFHVLFTTLSLMPEAGAGTG